MPEDGGAQLTVVVRLASGLRGPAGGADRLEVEVSPDPDLGEVLDAVASAHPSVGRRIRDEQGRVRAHVNVFVGSDNVHDLDGLETPVPRGTEVWVLAAVSGG